MLTDDLLAVQRADTSIDQLGHRRTRLPEREALTAAERERTTSVRRAAAIASRVSEVEAAIAAAEDEGRALTAHRERLQAQLKTVIAPREAEALMHEIETIGQRRDALDDVELEHLEEQTRLDDERSELEAARPAIDEVLAAARAALAAVEAELDAEVERFTAERGEAVARLDDAIIRDYEGRRRHHGGVAVATLEGRRCSGCNMDLSTSEFERAKATPPGELADCPQCGRLLVP